MSSKDVSSTPNRSRSRYRAFRGLLAQPWVRSRSLSASQGWAEPAQGELGEGDQSLGGAESKRAPSDQPDLGGERLHATGVDVVKQHGLDVGAVYVLVRASATNGSIRQRRAHWSQRSSEGIASS